MQVKKHIQARQNELPQIAMNSCSGPFAEALDYRYNAVNRLLFSLLHRQIVSLHETRPQCIVRSHQYSVLLSK